MTPGQIAQRYGAGAPTRRAFVRDIARLGLTARIDRSGVFARVTGSVGRFERAFGVRIDSIFSNAPNVLVYFVHDNRSLPLPAELRPLVDDVVATYAHAATPSGKPTTRATSGRATPTAREIGAARKPKRPRNTGTWTRGCRQARATGGYSFGQVRHAYGINRLEEPATGPRAAISTWRGRAEGRHFRRQRAGCVGLPRGTRERGGRRWRPAGGRTQHLRGRRGSTGTRWETGQRPRSQVWLSPQLWFLGASQVLDAAQLPDSLSISYAECERSIRGRGSSPATRAGADLMDSLFVRLGLAGVGSYAASGDEGSTCAGRPFKRGWRGPPPPRT